jgi:hypothetical protein
MDSSKNKEQPSFEPYCKPKPALHRNIMYCYLSPSPTHQLWNKESSGKSTLCSPPLMACKKNDELSPRSLDLQLESGRSLFNSKPAAVRIVDIPPTATNKSDTHTDQETATLPMPAYPWNCAHKATGHFNLEEDMPAMVTPPKLKMRTSKNFQEDEMSSVSPAEPSRGTVDCFFAPIRPLDDDSIA